MQVIYWSWCGAPTTASSIRRIPFHVREDVEKELERLEKLDIIKDVEEPTPWISPIGVDLKKSGEVRNCVDMREAKKAIKRGEHLIATIDDFIAFWMAKPISAHQICLQDTTSLSYHQKAVSVWDTNACHLESMQHKIFSNKQSENYLPAHQGVKTSHMTS